MQVYRAADGTVDAVSQGDRWLVFFMVMYLVRGQKRSLSDSSYSVLRRARPARAVSKRRCAFRRR